MDWCALARIGPCETEDYSIVIFWRSAPTKATCNHGKVNEDRSSHQQTYTPAHTFHVIKATGDHTKKNYTDVKLESFNISLAINDICLDEKHLAVLWQ